MINTHYEQRFAFFQRAFLNLNEVKEQENRVFSNLEKEGIVQRFERLIELCWKVLKDFLENEGFDVKSPKESMRKVFEYGLLKDCEKWLEALQMRNVTNHTYTQSALDENVRYILDEFYPLVRDLYNTLQGSPMNCGLSEKHLTMIREILMQHQAITHALLFGSHARGTFKAASDVDIALKGDIDIKLIAKIKAEFEESTFPFFVDIVDYAKANEELKSEIDTQGKILYLVEQTMKPRLLKSCHERIL